jgi:hypothetical protein
MHFSPSHLIVGLQEKFIHELDPLREGHIRDVLKNREFTEHNHQSYVSKYGEANIMDCYRPHITLTKFQTPAEAHASVLHLQSPFRAFVCNTIGVYVSSEDDPTRKPLGQFSLQHASR